MNGGGGNDDNLKKENREHRFSSFFLRIHIGSNFILPCTIDEKSTFHIRMLSSFWLLCICVHKSQEVNEKRKKKKINNNNDDQSM